MVCVYSFDVGRISISGLLFCSLVAGTGVPAYVVA
jgi:hypothetical protein